MKKSYIVEEEYKKILDRVPICCVDIIIKGHKGVLLVKRKNKPFSNTWWVPGGRVYKNEKLQDAAIRKVLEETGLNIKISNKVGVYETMSDENIFEDMKSGTHTINIVFFAELLNNKNINLDNAHLEYKWIESIEDNFHSYIKEILKDSEVFTE